jgi:hypothetical protein
MKRAETAHGDNNRVFRNQESAASKAFCYTPLSEKVEHVTCRRRDDSSISIEHRIGLSLADSPNFQKISIDRVSFDEAGGIHLGEDEV